MYTFVLSLSRSLFLFSFFALKGYLEIKFSISFSNSGTCLKLRLSSLKTMGISAYIENKKGSLNMLQIVILSERLKIRHMLRKIRLLSTMIINPLCDLHIKNIIHTYFMCYCGVFFVTIIMQYEFPI